MKKHVLNLILCCIMTASCLSVSAQDTGHYHRVGDTINGRSPIYYYQWWSEAWLADTSHRLLANRNYGIYNAENIHRFHGEQLQFFYTDSPIQIIGIATSCRTMPIMGGFVDFDTDPLYPEYLRLYDATEENFVLLQEVQYDRLSPKRYMNIESRVPPNVYQDCCYWTLVSLKIFNN